MECGPRYGYNPEGGKSYFMRKVEDEEAVAAAFGALGLTINMSRERSHFGKFLGSPTTNHKWLTMTEWEVWTQAVRIFAKIVADHPQTAYGGYCMVIQAKIWYVHHVVADTATFFVLVENNIKDPRDFPRADGQRGQDGWPGHPQLNQDGDVRSHHLKTMHHLLGQHPDQEDPVQHWLSPWEVKGAARNACAMRLRDEGDFLDSLGDVKPATKRRLERQRAGGIWLSVAPSRFYSTVLSKKEI
jgi:hypothetical protein